MITCHIGSQGLTVCMTFPALFCNNVVIYYSRVYMGLGYGRLTIENKYEVS